MSLLSGARLGVYEITTQIGQGGMGVVYRARDTKLDREVAIKVLPAGLAQDPERVARFEREARLLASLNHPNIAHVYGFEHATLSDGSSAHFLAMELVDGEDLAGQLTRGAIPIDDALAIATQIAEALEDAHEHGIVHRDLKPANVKIAPGGTVKVLDFGLAKAWEGAGAASAALSQSPTFAHSATQAGMILGTAAYMAPEQARGKPVDKRADIWAFGVVLYEMLTGRQLFAGETLNDVMAAVLTRDIRLDALPPATPASIRRLLRLCLERNPKNRLHDIADARILLDETLAGSTGDDPAARESATGGRRSAFRTALPWIAGVTAGGALGAAALWVLRDGTVDRSETPAFRVSIDVPDWGNVGYSTGLYLSPDGLTLGYHDRHDGSLRLRSLDSWDSRVVAGTASSRDGFLSPDGRWFAYCNENADTIEKVPIGGGTPVILASDVGVYNSGVWGASGYLYVSAGIGAHAGIWRLREDGSGLELLKDGDKSGMGWFLELLPGEQALLYTGNSQPSAGANDEGIVERIEALVLADNSIRHVLDGGRQARYLDPGRLVFVTGEKSLSVVDFDPKTLTVRGPPRSVSVDVRFDNGFNARYTVSRRGTLAYVPAASATRTGRIVRIGSDGRLAYGPDVQVGPRSYFRDDVQVSPDGTMLAVYMNRGGNSSVGLVDARRGAWSPLVHDSGTPVRQAVWSPDGARLALQRFGAYSVSVGQLWLADATGRGAAVQVKTVWPDFTGATSGIGPHRPGARSPDAATLMPETSALGNWSPDGSRLVASVWSSGGTADIWVVPTANGGKAEPFLMTDANEAMPRFSPDGAWVAYISDATGELQVYARPYPGPGREVAISRVDPSSVVWKADGTALYFARGQTVLEVPFQPGQPPRIGTERVVAQLPKGASPFFDLDRTTGDLVTIERPEIPVSDSVRMVIDWGNELARQARGNQ